MSKEEDKYFRVEEYLKGKLQGEELEDFEKELQSSEELQKLVHLSKLADDLVIANRLQEVKSIYKEEHLKAVNNNKYRNLGLSISGLLVLSSVFFWYNPMQNIEKRNQTEVKVATTEPVNNTLKIHDSIQETTIASPGVKEKGISEPKAQATKVAKTQKEESLISNSDKAEKPVPESDSGQKLAQINISIADSASIDVDTVKTIADHQAQTTNSEMPEKEIGCSSVNISSTITTISTCTEESNGLISVSGITGGEKPYSIKIVDKSDNEVEATGLKAGTYKVIISDKNECSAIEKVRVNEKNCSLDLHFNPFLGESLKLPENKTTGIFTVYDQSGNVYFEKDLPGGLLEEWTGNSKNGEIKAGYYIFTIRYTDGSIKKGTITISR